MAKLTTGGLRKTFAAGRFVKIFIVFSSSPPVLYRKRKSILFSPAATLPVLAERLTLFRSREKRKLAKVDGEPSAV